jgi:uncharacterized protein YcaQ
VCDRGGKVMSLRDLWWEEDVRPDHAMKQAVNQALKRLAEYNGCTLEKAI